MASTNQHVAIHQGGSYELEVPVTDSAGEPVNLTGKFAYYKISARPSTQSLASLSVDTQDAADGTIRITVPTSMTKVLMPFEYYHEVYIVEGSERHVVMTGRLILKASQAAQHVG